MSNIGGWITFREIVDSVQLSEGDTADTGQFMRKLNWAIKAYERLRLHSLPATKPVTLTIDAYLRCVVLPDDFLKLVSVGTVYEGRFVPFAPNSQPQLSQTGDCGLWTRTEPTTDADGNELTMYKPKYTLDLENRRIIIDAPPVISEVILNYTPTGVRTDGETYIPLMCRDVIEADIEYQYALRGKVSQVEKDTYFREYQMALNRFRGLQYSTDELFNTYDQHLDQGRQF